mmetsp:Transcript_4398/g.8876  ORF Transcript_4398/g.8876 Transcript_4398/m.8876 type:complete len:215 (+) Transcript_4398:425-1069(+)
MPFRYPQTFLTFRGSLHSSMKTTYTLPHLLLLTIHTRRTNTSRNTQHTRISHRRFRFISPNSPKYCRGDTRKIPPLCAQLPLMQEQTSTPLSSQQSRNNIIPMRTDGKTDHSTGGHTPSAPPWFYTPPPPPLTQQPIQQLPISKLKVPPLHIFKICFPICTVGVHRTDTPATRASSRPPPITRTELQTQAHPSSPPAVWLRSLASLPVLLPARS